MSKATIRVVMALLALTYVLSHFVAHAHAQSSLGIGTAEPSISPTGPLAHFFVWVNGYQQQFYRSMTTALKAMRDDGSQAWLLIGLSFAYGIFHAAGPGHGKVVISTYMVANDVAVRRGIMLSFVSSLLQALSAIIVIGAVFLVLRGTSISMTKATHWLEVASFALVAAYGAWLLWRKLRGAAGRLFARRPVLAMATAGGPSSPVMANLFESDGARQAGGSAWQARPHSFQPATETTGTSFDVCETCGQSHAADPALLDQEKFDLRAAWAAIVAVGIRPCSGALIVLTFALLNGLWFGGVVSVFAMALGTFITVALLATLAVTAKNAALAIAGSGSLGATVHTVIEIGGALFLLLMGLALLGASLSA